MCITTQHYYPAFAKNALTLTRFKLIEATSTPSLQTKHAPYPQLVMT
jgi:hypothetical protein